MTTRDELSAGRAGRLHRAAEQLAILENDPPAAMTPPWPRREPTSGHRIQASPDLTPHIP